MKSNLYELWLAEAFNFINIVPIFWFFGFGLSYDSYPLVGVSVCGGVGVGVGELVRYCLLVQCYCDLWLENFLIDSWHMILIINNLINQFIIKDKQIKLC